MAIQRGLTMLANLVDQALYVPEALLVLGNQTHATRGGSGIVAVKRDQSLCRIPVFPAAHQLIYESVHPKQDRIGPGD